jgi:hypothetical protein
MGDVHHPYALATRNQTVLTGKVTRRTLFFFAATRLLPNRPSRFLASVTTAMARKVASWKGRLLVSILGSKQVIHFR